MGVALLVGTDKGGLIARSHDRSTWDIGELAFTGWRVTCATRDATGRVYVGLAQESFGNAIMASDDLETWEQLDAVPRYEPGLRANPVHVQLTSSFPTEGAGGADQRQVDQIWTLHAAGDTLFAGVSEAGLFRSDDRGASWQPVDGLNEHPTREKWVPGFGGLCLHHILTDGPDARRIWVAISAAGVFRSDDGGETFTRRVEGAPPGEDGAVCVHSLVHPAGQPDRIYAQFHDGMFRSLDGADTWERIETGLPQSQMTFEHVHASFGFATAFDQRTGTVFNFPLTGDDLRYPHDGKVRVYRSQDGGDSWHPCDRGLPTEPRFGSVLRGAMSSDGLDPCGIYVGTTSGQIYASPDLGESWSELPVTLPRILCVEAFAT